MNSCPSTPDPELILLVDSDDEQEESSVMGTSGCSEKSHLQFPLPQQQQHSTNPFSQSPPTVLQELFGIVQWVNTGVRRNKSCEKTFMEKQVDELEKNVQTKEQQLNLANKEITELKQSKIDLQKEIEKLQLTLKVERKEKLALNRKWAQMKETFKTLQSTYFEDIPGMQANGIEKHRKLDIAHLKKEHIESVHYAPEPEEVPENQDVPLSTMDQNEAPFPGGPEIVPEDYSSASTITGVEVLLGSESGIQLQDEQPCTSKSNELKDNSKMTEVNHAFDKSKQNLGVFCVCGMQFSTKRTLDSHIIYFTCEKRFLCNLCDKRFVGTNYLKGHMLRSHKVSYTGGLNGCRDCGKTFSSLLQLRRHKKLAHYASYPVNKVPRVLKKDIGAGVTTSTKKRRSIRMKRRHQKGESHSALSMLQGNCNNCKFCREAEKRKPKTASQIVHCTSDGASGNARIQPQKLQLSSTSTAAIVPSKPRTRYRSSSVSSEDSTSFTCDYCSRWFGDDKSGLIKHLQSCEVRFP